MLRQWWQDRAAVLLTGLVAALALIGSWTSIEGESVVAVTFGGPILVTAIYFLRIVLRHRDDPDRGVAQAGRAAAASGLALWLGMLPLVASGHLNDEETGTIEGIFLMALIACVIPFLAGLVTVLVLLPLWLMVRSWVMAYVERTPRAAVLGTLLTGVPLLLVAMVVMAALALGDLPGAGWPAAEGAALLGRTAGLPNGVPIEDPGALYIARVLGLALIADVLALVLWVRRECRTSEVPRN